MGTRSLGTLTIDVIAEVGGFVSGMDKAERKTEAWRKSVEKAAAAVGNAIGVGIATGITALTAMTVATVNQANEIAKLAQIAGTGTTEFQRYAAGAEAMGIQQDKLADIFKDTQDKVGDFLQNGGGPLKDFFDNIAPKIGVTAKQFQNLSGPQALQLYVDSLQKAKVPQGDMVFYMEAIASDATMLLPLLRDGGEGFRDFGDAAAAAGAILGEDTVANAQKMKAEVWLVQQQLQGFKNNLVEDILPVITDIGATLLTSSKDASKSVSGYNVAGQILRWMAQGAAGAAAALELAGKALGAWAAAGQASMSLDISGIRNIWKDFTADASATAQKWGGIIEDFGNAGTEAGKASEQVDKLAKALGGMPTGGGKPGDQGAGAAAAKAAAAAQKQLQAAYNEELLKYQRIVDTTNTSAGKLAKTTNEQAAIFDTTKGKLKALSDPLKQDIINKAKAADATLALKAANEDLAKSAEFAASLSSQNKTAAESLNIDFIGAGQGTEARARAKELLSIQQDFQKQQADLQKQYQSGDISKELYDTETAALKSALDERIQIQEDYYKKTDEQRDNWKSGMSDAWADYARGATDYNKQAADAVSGFLDTTTGDVAETIEELVKGNESLFDGVKNLAASMGETVINTLAKMAAQWLVYKAVQMSIGDTGQSAAAQTMIGNAAATAAQAALAAYASTAAIPFTGPAMAPGAAAAALAATAPFVAAVSAGALVGQAHDGIDSVPQTGTWLLQKGERVTTASTSAKLDATLDRVGATVSGGGGDTFNFHNNINGSLSDRERMMMETVQKRSVIQAKKELTAEYASGTGDMGRAAKNWTARRRVK